MKKKMKLIDVVRNKHVFEKLYSGITDFNRVLEIDKKTIEPMERLFKNYDKKLAAIREEYKDKPEKGDEAYKEMVLQDVEIDFVTITKKEAEKIGFNVFEYQLVKDLIK